MSDIAEVGELLDEAAKEKRLLLSDSRIEFAKKSLAERDINFVVHDCDSLMVGEKHKVHFFPYSGWFQGRSMTGKAIKGRGINNLIKQYRG